jgi:hypothetical protein
MMLFRTEAIDTIPFCYERNDKDIVLQLRTDDHE